MSTRHCKTCHKPLKGHSRELCNLVIDIPSSPAKDSSTPLLRRTRKSAPLPTLSPESGVVLNNLLRAHSFSAPPPISSPQVKREKGKRRVVVYEESLQETLDRIAVEEGDGSSSNASKHEIEIIEPLTIQITHHLKLEDPIAGPSSSEGPPADLAMQNFLNAMSNNPDNPPAALFSFPKNAVSSLRDMVEASGLFMVVVSLPDTKDNWIPLVVGRSLQAIGSLLDDGERLALGLRRPLKFNASEWDLGFSHVVVGALGALATWAGLAYC
ncbi:hypothetical protein M422DRAFT_773285 [Sphaerobolus stellatus SS14]|nr:hypothetical protein M422DRAFT_773285 [Sphaerobolus stellatus SS14]